MKYFIFLFILIVEFTIAHSADGPSEIQCSKGQSQECLSVAKNFYKNGKINEALKIFKEICDSGELQGCSGQGVAEYKLGNKVEAIILLSKACDGKILKACEVMHSLSENPSQNKKSPPVKNICNIDYPKKLLTCIPFSCFFHHPFTSTIMKREIVGEENGKCKTTEEMPNNESMTCLYPRENLKVLSEYYAIKGNSKNKLTNDKKTLKKEPLKEALEKGICKVSGF